MKKKENIKFIKKKEIKSEENFPSLNNKETAKEIINNEQEKINEEKNGNNQKHLNYHSKKGKKRNKKCRKNKKQNNLNKEKEIEMNNNTKNIENNIEEDNNYTTNNDEDFEKIFNDFKRDIEKDSVYIYDINKIEPCLSNDFITNICTK